MFSVAGVEIVEWRQYCHLNRSSTGSDIWIGLRTGGNHKMRTCGIVVRVCRNLWRIGQACQLLYPSLIVKLLIYRLQSNLHSQTQRPECVRYREPKLLLYQYSFPCLIFLCLVTIVRFQKHWVAQFYIAIVTIFQRPAELKDSSTLNKFFILPRWTHHKHVLAFNCPWVGAPSLNKWIVCRRTINGSSYYFYNSSDMSYTSRRK